MVGMRLGSLSSLLRGLTGLAGVWLFSAAATAQTVKLNGPLAQPGAGDVLSYRISPDDAYVVYRADQDADDVFELFGAPSIGGTPPVRLSAALAAGGDVIDFSISAGGRVVYRADQETDGVFELFSVPRDGSAPPVKLSGPHGTVSSYWLVAGGASVVFTAAQQLFRVPVDGSAAPSSLTPAYAVGSAWLDAAGSTALFATSGSVQEHLYSVPTDGSAAPILLATSSVPTGGFTYTVFADVRFALDGLHATFDDALVDDGQYTEVKLYGVPLDGSQPPSKLNLQTAALDSFPVFPGVDRVAYEELGNLYSIRFDGTQRAQLDLAGWVPGAQVELTSNGLTVVFAASTTGGVDAIFRAPLDGSQAATAIVAPGVFSIQSLSLVNSVAVVYGAIESSFGALRAVPLSGAVPPVLLNGPPQPNQGLAYSDSPFQTTPDGLQVVFLADHSADEVYELFVSPIDGSQPRRRLSAPMSGPKDVGSFLLGPQGQGAAYLADASNDGTFELFGVPLSGSTPPFRYNEPLPAGPVLGDVLGFQPTPDETHVVYLADQDTDGFNDLYSARIDGHGAPRRLTAPLSEFGDVLEDFAFSPGGERVVFQYLSPRFYYLYSAPTAPGQPPLELDQIDYPFGFPFTVTADGARVVYRKRTFSFGDYTLRSALLDGSAPPVTLADLPGDQAFPFVLSPDGLNVVYLADQDVAGVNELYRIPSDGSGPALKLSAPLSGTRDVDAFRLSADGSHVVYRADQSLDEQFELCAVPFDLSSAPVSLCGPLASGGDVTDFAITPDGQRVVYRADEAVDNQFELFSARLDGSAKKRLTTLAANLDVETDFTVSPDSQQVLFRADALTNGVLELFRVPCDGSASPLRLSAALVAAGDVNAFALAPDQSRVVYLADQTSDGVFALFSVPFGGGPVVPLGALPPAGDVSVFRISPDSLSVVFLADALTDQVPELFRVPADGSAAPERLNRALPPGGAVQDDFLPLDAGRVLFRADQESNDVLELYLSLDVDARFLHSGTPSRSVTRHP